ncbi:MAG: fibronectin type III domain-containing protein [Methanoregula sp.]|jgi:hypothetical protein
MTGEKNHSVFIVLFCCFLLSPGVLVIPASAGNTGATLITAKISLAAFDITATAVNQNFATITWKTNGNADSIVEYGLTTAYGSARTNSSVETNHTITLGGLAPDTLYHWRVVSGDQDGNKYVSTDYTFRTLTATPVVPGTNVNGGGGGSAPAQIISSGIPMLFSEEGQILQTYIVTTGEEGRIVASVTVPLGTTIHGLSGETINILSVKVLEPDEVPPVPDSAPYSFSGFSVQCLPDGATFSKPASLKFHLTTYQWTSLLKKANSSTGSLSVRFYDKVNVSWIRVPVRVDPSNLAVMATITHFSTYGLFIDATKMPVVTGNPTTTTPVPTVTVLPAQTAAFPAPVGSVQWTIIFSALITIVAAGAGYYLVTKKK